MTEFITKLNSLKAKESFTATIEDGISMEEENVTITREDDFEAHLLTDKNGNTYSFFYKPGETSIQLMAFVGGHVLDTRIKLEEFSLTTSKV